MDQAAARLRPDERIAPALLGVERSVTGRRWRSRLADERAGLLLAQRLGLPEIVGRVLAARGVAPEEAPGFLEPRLRDALPDPSHLRDMDIAAERLARAIRQGEKVAVFGDYDVDGATSSALLLRFFRAAGSELTVYIPDRQKEGYGPNAEAMRTLHRKGVRVVVTVDCGTLAFAPLQTAAALGLEVIVVDHHKAEPRLPEALAVINPNRLDETSPLGDLAAVGLAFLLAVAVNRTLREAGWYAARPEPDLMRWLDLVALGTVADVVPLRGLNRVLVRQGLRVLAGRRNAGLAALCDVGRLEETPRAFHLGFVLGPRINAGGRVGTPDLGTRLLSCDVPEEAARLAAELDRLNRERQSIETEIADAAFAAIEARAAGGDGLIFAMGEDWHPGVIGIVASRLVERFGRPAVVVGVGADGIAKGSGRSVAGIDLGAAFIAAGQAGLLVSGGGHAMAAGLTAQRDRLEQLRKFLCERVGRQLTGAPPDIGLELDGAVQVRGATRELFELFERAGPYGSGYAEPRLAVPQAGLVKAERVGSDHVRLLLSGRDGGRLKAIAFRCADQPLGQALLQAGPRPLHLAGHLRADDWGGRQGVQLVVEDAAWADAG